MKRVGSALAVAAITLLTAARGAAQLAVPPGVWLLEGKAAVRIFECDGLMCGRILWMRIPRDAEGERVLDKKNPDPALRRRPLCGLTIIGDLRPDVPGHWTDGWLYNPDDGVKYKVTARLESDDVIVARAYLLLPLFGKTLTLTRVPRGTSEGRC